MMSWQWRLRTMLILIAFTAVATWGIYLRWRSDAFRGLAAREAGIKAKLLEMAADADVKEAWYKEFAESLARSGSVSVYETNDPHMRDSNAVRLGLFWIAALPILSVANAQGPSTRTFEARKYGVSLEVPKSWKATERDTFPFAFIFLIPQPGREEVNIEERNIGVTCRVWIAEENLEAERAALEDNERALKGIAFPHKIDVRLVESPQGRRLDVLTESLEDGRVCGREREVSFIANRQRYDFSLATGDEKRWPEYDAAFKAMLDSVKFTPPDTGAVLVDKARNRWLNHHNHVAIDLPDGWAPVLNPNEGDQFWATGPAHAAVWPHNFLKVSRRPGKLDLAKLAKSRPDELRHSLDAEHPDRPPHKVLKCELVKQGKFDALEIIFVRFSDTVYERQFHVDGFNFEVSFTIESRRFNDLSPVIRKCLDSFQVVSRSDPIGGTKRADRRRGDIDLLGWGSWTTQGFRVRTLGRRPLRIGLRPSSAWNSHEMGNPWPQRPRTS